MLNNDFRKDKCITKVSDELCVIEYANRCDNPSIFINNYTRCIFSINMADSLNLCPKKAWIYVKIVPLSEIF